MATRPLVPTDVNAAGWYDASDSSTITLVSNAVSQWNDKSGNARNVVQNNATFRPSVLSNALNGMSAIQFGAHNLITPTFLTLLQPLSVIAIFQNSTATGFNIVFDGSQDYNGSRAIGFTNRPDENNRPCSAAGGTRQQIGTTSVANIGPFFLTWAFDNTTTLGAINGTVGINPAVGASGVTKGFTIGGNPNDANNQMNGTLCELVIVPSTTPATLRQMEGYLAWKWGQQGLLPANHPYKAAAPTVTTADTGTNYPASTSDAGVASDAVSASAVASAAAVDVGAASSSETATAAGKVAASDTGAASDTVTAASANTGAASDAGAAADQVSATSATSVAATDTGAASDAASGRAAATAALADAGTVQDTASASQSATGSVADNNTVTDVVSATFVPVVAVSDTGAASDTISARASAAVSVSDAGSASDTAGYVGQVIVPVTPPYVQPISPPGSGGTMARGGRYSSYDPVLHRRREQEEEEARRPRPTVPVAPALPALGTPLTIEPSAPSMLPPDAALGALPPLPALVDPMAALLADDEDAIALLLAA